MGADCDWPRRLAALRDELLAPGRGDVWTTIARATERLRLRGG